MRSSGDTGSPKRNVDRSQTDHPQRDRCDCQNALYIVGIGPGDATHLSGRAREVLTSVGAVAGYTTYIDLVKPLLQSCKVIQTGMTREVERVSAAIDLAVKGTSCALISSGDPGIYAMAGLALEMCQSRQIKLHPVGRCDARSSEDGSLFIEVVPGIPALCAGAALLGAPLTHDFAAVSLSDLLTPWQKIEHRLDAAARADFVIVLYNPKSKRRAGHLAKAQAIIARHRSTHTPVGVVSRATRTGERISITTLADLHLAEVDMQTTVFIGNSTSIRYGDFMITPRGYSAKYRIDEPPAGRGKSNGRNADNRTKDHQ